MTLTREGLEEALKLAGAATPGPWEQVLSADCSRVWVTTSDGDQEFDVGRSVLDGGIVEQNAAFIAFSREAVPAMARAILSALDRIADETYTAPEGLLSPAEASTNAALESVRAALLGSDEAR